MSEIRECLYCGELFQAKHHRNMYCSAECKIYARRERDRAKKRKPILHADVTIEQMIDAAIRLSEERGKLVQYGDVQAELMLGNLIVKDGVIVEKHV